MLRILFHFVLRDYKKSIIPDNLADVTEIF